SDHSAAAECLLVTGPRARDVLAPLVTGHDLAAPWLSVSDDGTVAGRECALIRVSFAGELGWEIHAAPGDMPAIWDALAAAGAVPFGMYALDALRIEKGYRTWKGDLSLDVTLLEAGLDRFLDLDKALDFPGKAALVAERAAGPARRFVSLIVEGAGQEPRAMATIRHGGEAVGAVTSAAWGHRVGASVAHAVIRADLAVPGRALEVEVFGRACRAVVQPLGPLWDPENARLRA
ncbi:MAG: aminomethyltransferase family protein, partial [Maritimibacter sp.]|nr:aminomethyltransferase family protein [Maritimibacter sp.]